jgi:hypothetical protein
MAGDLRRADVIARAKNLEARLAGAGAVGDNLAAQLDTAGARQPVARTVPFGPVGRSQRRCDPLRAWLR